MVVKFDADSALAPFVDMIWQSHSVDDSAFTSTASANWELVFTTYAGTTTVTARGPETKASRAEAPAGAFFFGITFKLGAFVPDLQLKLLCDRQDATLPAASSSTFWLHGTRWERPTAANADVFLAKLIRQGSLVRDPLVVAALQGRTPDLSQRAMQYRFVQATGLTHSTIRQIERARHAVALLEQGMPIADAACDLGYFDQAHLTNALRRFAGATPGHIAHRHSAS